MFVIYFKKKHVAAANEYYMMRDKNHRAIGQTSTDSTYLETAAHVCHLLMCTHIIHIH